jgi:tetratricopeptide (TPR) repeat protein
MRLQKYAVVVFALTVFGILPLTASEVESLFMKANEYYQSGNYSAAIAEYQKIRDLGYESWELYFNLGNAYYKDRQIARAILNYERAKKLDPKNEDINFNLELANLSVVDLIPRLPQFILFEWISNLAAILDLTLLGIISVTLYVLFIGFLSLMLFVKTSAFVRVCQGLVIITGVLWIIFSGLFSIRVYENESTIDAIVLSDKVDVKSAPIEAGTAVFSLHQGVKVQIKEQSGDWVKIRLADGKIGWMKQTNLEQI